MYYCPVCFFRIESEIKMQEHYTEEHLVCKVCNKRFTKRKRLVEHNKRVHTKSYYCDSCGLDFGKKSCRDKHNLKCEKSFSYQDRQPDENEQSKDSV